MARTGFKKTKLSSKPTAPKLAPGKAPSPPAAVVGPVQSTSIRPNPSLSSEEDSEDDGGVDEEGMKHMMRLLGEDGLDDVAEYQLGALGPDESASGSDKDDGGEDESDSEEEEGATVGGGEGGSENGWVDEDEEMEAPENSGANAVVDEEESSEDEDEEEQGEDDDAVPLDEVSDVDEDAVPKQKVVINNELALKRIRETIELGKDMPWTETLAFTTSEPLDIPNADDDLNRELAFYKQALSTANTARAKFSAAKLQFSRPPDYFAEMVKSDSHMERIRQRLLDERAGIQKSEAAKKQRELKKVGKQVQVEKLKEREKSKKEMNERVKGLKRKRGGALDAGQDSEAFDVAVEDAISDRPAKRANMNRSKRDAKFGFGGAGTKGRRGKQNTKESSESFDFRDGTGREASKGHRGGRGGGRGGRGGGRGGARGGSKRLGKSRRQPGKA